ncbi:hypothetical protein Pth03_09910 [Planotetraspora thailandica]|uniref:Uncharacterized protein n=1 Tax=Planotetraspora thailandica TaxID=487172 RepID=A0A8J3UZB3_9ACTN|nr:hypothetical protein [Planotetraspora thailandica]GII52602.1 hypothetical protein Pth03_09910 [Planotetraspora thailandica]
MNTGPRILAALAAPAQGRDLTVVLGVAGGLLLLAVLVHLIVGRLGGWRAVRRRVRREVALTVTAFTAPFRARVRYRRRLRLLVRLLGQPAGWADAERAMLNAARTGIRPYAALLGPDRVGVMIASGPGDPPQPPDPWVADSADPRLWWIDRARVSAPAHTGGTAPLLVAVGTDGDNAVLLDLMPDPPVIAIGGDPRMARPVLQTIAAQVDARLPEGAVTVAGDVHPRHPGPDASDALAAAARHAASGSPSFAVCGAAPVGVPVPRGVRLITAGVARGRAWLLTADRSGTMLVHGSPLQVDILPLPAAMARVIGTLPAYETAYEGLPQSVAADLVAPPPADPPARSAVNGSRSGVSSAVDDFTEPERQSGGVGGVSAGRTV